MLSSHAVARTLIAALGAGLTGVFTANPITAAATGAALSTALSEWVSAHESTPGLRDGVQLATAKLAEDLEGKSWDKVDKAWALSLCADTLSHASPETLRVLLVSEPDSVAVAALLSDRHLSQGERDQVVQLMTAALREWHLQIDKHDPLLGALREQLGQAIELGAQQQTQLESHRRDIDTLALQGLELPLIKRYQSSDAPSRLFRPEYQVLPLQGRLGELSSLRAWCDHEHPFGLRALAAPGGVGKTRLAMELMQHYLAQGWLAAWVRDAGRLNTLTVASELPQQVLLVLDYADYQSAQLQALAKVAEALVGGGRRVRVLLLARPDTAWWETAQEHFEEGYFNPPEEMAPRLEALWRPALASSAGQIVLNAVATAAGRERPASAEDFHAPADATPLMWMMAAYRFLFEADSTRQAIADDYHLEDLCRLIIKRHEREYIRRKLSEKGLQARYTDAAMQALALFSFAGGVADLPACEALLERVPALAAAHESGNRQDVLAVLKTTYPNYTGIGALQPDLLAEYLCAESLDAELMHVFVEWVLAMIADRRNDRKDHIEWMLPLAYADQVCDRAGQWPEGATPAQLGGRWESVFRSLPIELIGLLAGVDDTANLELRDLNARIAEIHLSLAGQSPEKRAHALNNQAVDLASLGKREEALAAAQEAVALFGELAEQRPDAFRPVLATSLNNVATFFSEVGKREEALAAAQEAVAIRRELAEQRPDAFRPVLATSLNNVATFFSEVGKREEALAAAQEAVAIRRELAEQRPDAFRPDLAGSLNNVATFFSEVGKREEALAAAQEAVAIRRELAEQRPDAFRPDLAGSLNNVANRFSEVGKREEALAAAQEAVALYEELAEQRPDAFRPDLAMSLNNVANYLSDVGKREEALAAAQEAVAIRRELAEQRPDAFRPDLAMSLNNVANRFSEVGKREEALAAAQEAVAIRRELAEQRPDAFRPDLAMSLNNVATFFSEVGKREEALAAAQEAVAIRRELAEQRPDAFRPDLAMSLNNVANRFSEVGKREEALAAAQESVQLYGELAQRRPDAFMQNWAISLRGLCGRQRECGRFDESCESGLKSTELFAQLWSLYREVFAGQVMASMREMLQSFEAAGKDQEAAIAALEQYPAVLKFFEAQSE